MNIVNFFNMQREVRSGEMPESGMLGKEENCSFLKKVFK